MSVIVELHNVGHTPVRGEIVAVVEHVLSDRPGTWRVTILGSRGSDTWEMKVEGPKGFERSYMVTGKAGEHEPSKVASVLAKLIPAQGSSR